MPQSRQARWCIGEMFPIAWEDHHSLGNQVHDDKSRALCYLSPLVNVNHHLVPEPPKNLKPIRKARRPSPPPRFAPARNFVFPLLWALLLSPILGRAADALEQIRARGVLRWAADAEGGAP